MDNTTTMRKAGNFNESLGDLESLGTFAHGIILNTVRDVAVVTVYSPEIIRIRIHEREKETRDFSYAVIKKAENTEFEIDEGEQQIQLATRSVRLVINKFPLRFAFYNMDGNLINGDELSFGSSRIGTEVTTYKQLQPGERFIGLGEKTGNLDRNGTAYTNWNTDKFAYSTDADPIYMSIPFFIGVHSGLSYGIFFDNTHKTKFNFGASNDRFSSFSAEDGEMNYYFIYGEGVRDILKNYSELTGKIELPPLWSLGLQQCRYSYYPDTQVLNVARTFREKHIPADVIYLDIHYMDEYKVFTFDPVRFSEPEQMVKELEEMGFHTVVIMDPGIKREEGYATYDDGIEKNVFATYPDGDPYAGEVWPGWSHFPDFTKPEVREWWGEQIKFYTDMGIDGYWNDMNEPAVWGQTIPDLIEFNYEGEGATHKKARNVYGMQMGRSTYNGAKKLLGKRPFVLNRAGYAGIQRYAASWTGDNVASDDHMLCGIRLLTSLGLSGVSYTGYDVGGFTGGASANLFSKWIVAGAFSPMFRCHSMINSHSAEPWSFGEEAEEIARNYINLRYRLLPYIYSTFYESSQNGMPIARSLAIDHTHDEKIYNHQYQNQYYFGDAFLVAPVTSNATFVKVYFPEGIWYDLHNGWKADAGEFITEVRGERYPLFIKGSSIIPMQSVIQSVKQKPDETLEIHFYYGEAENNFTYYEDDGETYNHLKNDYYKRVISYIPFEDSLLFAAVEGKRQSKFSAVKLYFHGFDSMSEVTINGETVEVENEDYQFIPPVSNFDPFYKAQATDMMEENVPFVQFENLRDEISIQW